MHALDGAFASSYFSSSSSSSALATSARDAEEDDADDDDAIAGADDSDDEGSSAAAAVAELGDDAQDEAESVVIAQGFAAVRQTYFCPLTLSHNCIHRGFKTQFGLSMRNHIAQCVRKMRPDLLVSDARIDEMFRVWALSGGESDVFDLLVPVVEGA